MYGKSPYDLIVESIMISHMLQTETSLHKILDINICLFTSCVDEEGYVFHFSALAASTLEKFNHFCFDRISD